MEKFKRQEMKEKRKEDSLQRHAGLHKLFVEDRLAFERERKRMIDEFMDNIEDDERRKRMRELQDSWDHKMRHAGSEHNRFVLAQTLFWDHFFNNWQPAMQQLNVILNKNM